MDDLLKYVLPSMCGPDQIREAREFLSERSIFSMEDMVKTNEYELKTCKLFNQISVGKIRALLRKENPDLLKTFDDKSRKKFENDIETAKQKFEDLKNANCKMEHLKDCEKEEMKVLDAEEKDFKERLQMLEEIEREALPHVKSSENWRKLNDVESELKHAKHQLDFNRKLREERLKHYETERKIHEKIFNEG